MNEQQPNLKLELDKVLQRIDGLESELRSKNQAIELVKKDNVDTLLRDLSQIAMDLEKLCKLKVTLGGDDLTYQRLCSEIQRWRINRTDDEIIDIMKSIIMESLNKDQERSNLSEDIRFRLSRFVETVKQDNERGMEE